LRTKIVVWRWKANILNYVGRDDVIGIWIPTVLKNDDPSLSGRDGYVGFKVEMIKEEGKDAILL